MRVNQTTVKKILAVVLTLAIWQAAAMALDQKVLLASPVSVLARLTSIWREPDFLHALWFSFIRRIAASDQAKQQNDYQHK